MPALFAAEEAEQSKIVQEAEGYHIAQASHGGIAAVGEHITIYASSAPLQPTPATPPAPPAHFIGRRHQLEQLKAITHSNQAAALYGMGGIGKTATAQQLAAELSADFPGGVFWADLPDHDGNPRPILRAWARANAHDLSTETDLNALAALVRGLLAARKAEQGPLLTIVDDLRREWLDATELLKRTAPADFPFLATTHDEALAAALSLAIHRLGPM